MNKDQIKLQMVKALKMAWECQKEANVFSVTANGILTGIIAVKIFDALSESE